MQVLRPAELVGLRIVQQVVDAHANVAMRSERGAYINLACGIALPAGPAAAVDDEHAGILLSVFEFLRQIKGCFFTAISRQVGDGLLSGSDRRGSERNPLTLTPTLTLASRLPATNSWNRSGYAGSLSSRPRTVSDKRGQT